jgi:hypothetical protein
VNDQSFYLVIDRIGKDDILFHETSLERTDLESVIKDLRNGHYDDPLRVVAFNTDEKWSQDVSEDVARELQRRADLACEDLSSPVQDFVNRLLGSTRQLSLPLA